MTIRRLPLVFAAGLLLTAAIAVACDDNDSKPADSPSGDRLRVVATTVQIQALALEVGGSEIELAGIVPSGGDPHAFEPTASDLAAIEDADVILRHGMELDEWLDGTLEAATSAAITAVTADVPTAGDDPHVWLDPANAQLMVDAIAGALSDADPNSASAYEANAAAYSQVLADTETEVQKIIDEIPPAQRKMVTDHDAFSYFARAFGLEVVGAIFPVLSTEGEPSAQETADLLDLIEREGVKAVFAEQSVNSQLARSLASDAGIAIVDDLYGDSLGEPGSGADTVHGMLVTNARKIADALK